MEENLVRAKNRAEILAFILFVVFVSAFIFGAVWFGIHYSAIETARQIGETAQEFYPIIWVAVFEGIIGFVILILYLKYFAFDFRR